MSNNKFEKLIDLIVNEETEAARELFHNLVVEKSREIYNELVEAEEMEDEEEEEEELEENFGEDNMSMDKTDDMLGDIDSDEMGMDADDDGMDGDDDGMDGDDDGMDGEEDLEDRVYKLEDALEELKAEFEELMSDEASEPGHHDGVNDPGFGNETGEEDEEEMEGFVREYVEKVAKPSNSEGQPVGAVNSSPSSTNARSPMNSKAAMAGAAMKFGGTGENPDDKQYKKPSNAYSKGEGNLKGAGSFENVPGAKAGKAFSNAKKPVSKDGAAGTKSPIAK